MKKLRIVCLVAAALMLLTLFAACDTSNTNDGAKGTMSLKDIVDGSKYVDDGVTYTQVEEIGMLSGKDYESKAGDLILFVTESGYDYYNGLTKQYMVYDQAAGKTVYSETTGTNLQIEDVSISSYTYGDLITVKARRNGEEGTRLYDATGSYIAEADSYTSEAMFGDLIRFDNKYYRFTNDGKIEYAFDKPVFGSEVIGDYYYHNDKYYYTYDYDDSESGGIFDGESSDGGHYVTVYFYDKSLKLVSYFSTPGYANATAPVILGNGKVFIQYSFETDVLSDDYDVLSGSKKYELASVVVDPATGKATDVKVDGMVQGLSNMINTNSTGFSDEIANVVAYCPIENKRIDSSYRTVRFATVGDDGNVILFEQIDNKSVIPYKMVNSDLWLALSLTFGNEYTFNANGEILKELTGRGSMNEKLVLADGKIFDYQLNQIYDYKASGYSLYETFDEKVLLVNETSGSVAICGEGGIKYVATVDMATDTIKVGGEMFAINKGGEVTIYNANGDYLYTVNMGTLGRLVRVMTFDDEVIVCVSQYSSYDYSYTYKYYKVH